MQEKKEGTVKKLVRKPEAFVGFGEILIGAGKALTKIGKSMVNRGTDSMPGKTVDAPVKRS